VGNENLPEDWGGPQWCIADPGNAGAIDNTRSGICHLKSTVTPAETQTRTLGRPAYLGQELWLVFHTDAGQNIETTVTGGVTTAGANLLALADAGDVYPLIAVQTTDGALVWRVFKELPDTQQTDPA